MKAASQPQSRQCLHTQLHASLTIYSCYVLEGWGLAKLREMKDQFTSFHLLSMGLCCSTNIFLLFGSFWKLVLYLLNHFTTMYEIICRARWFFVQYCLGQDPKWEQSARSMLFKQEHNNKINKSFWTEQQLGEQTATISCSAALLP